EKLFVVHRDFGSSSEAVVMFAGGDRGPKHLHLDILRRDFFSNVPPQNSSEDQIGSMLASFIGESILLIITGEFVLPLSGLPADNVILATMVKGSVGEVGVTQTASTLEITGAGPIRGIEWSLRKSTQEIDIELEMRMEMLIDSAYVSKVQSILRTAFRGFVLGEKNNG
ncbi:MAG TPA: hypothetical protein VHS31_04960, partial [Tepidisphaeraceae bacterium]|nr:hypothetical protein [Tepidisphaeraceae bacterium]